MQHYQSSYPQLAAANTRSAPGQLRSVIKNSHPIIATTLYSSPVPYIIIIEHSLSPSLTCKRAGLLVYTSPRQICLPTSSASLFRTAVCCASHLPPPEPFSSEVSRFTQRL